MAAPFPNWPDPCIRRCGGLGVTKRGELRLLEPRIPGTGALFFCEQLPDAMANTLGNPYKTGMGKRVAARVACGKSPAIEGYGGRGQGRKSAKLDCMAKLTSGDPGNFGANLAEQMVRPQAR